MPRADLQRWKRLWKRLGAEGRPEPAFYRLAYAYGRKDRFYHTLEHIGHCLDEIQPARALCRHPDEMELALWFHDIVLDPRRRDGLNVKDSARAGHTAARKMGLAPAAAERVRRMVMATTHRDVPRNMECRLVADADMALLGWSKRTFTRNYAQIRREHHFRTQDDFESGHVRFCGHLLRLRAVFLTGFFRRRYEAQARRNLRDEFRRLGVGPSAQTG
ncbi:MAG TPA: hypothetical protein DD417_01290 [Elusimicrobia bacterium]|nr:hypothetical protein [Elusimicrobiota bacterium]